MQTLNRFVLLVVLAGSVSAEPMAGDLGVPAGDYTLDRSHASLVFRVSHMGFSMYTARFLAFDVRLHFDPAAPQASTLEATVDARSIETDFPTPDVVDFNHQLQGEEWLDTAHFPTMTYRANRVEMNGSNHGRVLGELTLRGVTRSVPLDVTFNGGYPGMAMDPHARVGFSAHATLKRSEFGMDYGIPAAGSNLGVADQVEVIIEAELSGPPWSG